MKKKTVIFFQITRIKQKYSWIPNCQGTWDLRGSTTIYNTVITNQITNCTQSIVHTSFGFIDNLKFKINFLVKINLDEFPTIVLKFFFGDSVVVYSWFFIGLTDYNKNDHHVKVNWGLEGTSDIHGNSKTRRGIHFMVELLFNKNASTQSGSNIMFDFVRPALSTGVFVK